MPVAQCPVLDLPKCGLVRLFILTIELWAMEVWKKREEDKSELRLCWVV